MIKLGSAIEAVTKKAGVKTCGGCKKAKELLNSGDPKQMLKGAAMIPGNAISIMRDKAKEPK